MAAYEFLNKVSVEHSDSKTRYPRYLIEVQLKPKLWFGKLCADLGLNLNPVKTRRYVCGVSH